MANGTPSKSRYWLIAGPYLWLFIFFLIPFAIVAKISLSDAAIARPPYIPTLDLSGGWAAFTNMLSKFDFENYVWLTEEALYWKSYVSSLEIAAVSTLLTLVVGFPVAYGMSRAPAKWRPTLVMLIILPFWTSFLIRVYAWIGILKKEGLLNLALMSAGLIDEPLIILNTNTAVYIGIVYSYLPFMVLPVYASLERLDDSLLEAARDLGCTRTSAFWTVTAPLAIPGIVAGSLLVFIPAVGEFVIPDLLGGSETLMIGKTLWVEFFSNRDWPVASAVAVVLLAMLVVPIVLFQKVQERIAGLK
jgi:putrescine transport system permease protein